ncbi:MAG: FAD-dependent thymidylate synthase [Myxococcales bacterium]|nr:MAG: FAD-dependent thymidylate synthase [Myxococcales bacterium]
MEIITPSAVIETPESHIEDYARLLERFGRTSHPTDGPISDESASAFLRRYAIELGHESLLEHCVVSARFICDRSASHQLVRHRLGSYTQESQRVSDYSASGIRVICPPTIRQDAARFTAWKDAVERAESAYRTLLAAGAPPEDARAVLPNCTKTELVATFNLRQWRHVFIQRALNPRAQWQIRELMTDLLKQLVGLLPSVFGDLQQKILYRLVFEDTKNIPAKD